MLLSKSFGYALRGMLYIALLHDENRKVQIEEIATQLSVPKHFLGKIMQQLVKAGLLQSTKGPNGGFSLTENSLSAPLTELMEITNDMEQFRVCVLKLKACDSTRPCPLHWEIEEAKTQMLEVFKKTTINDLLTGNKNSFIKSLSII
jgi:Rrf2 family transcriptional regulator, iron-sulfur cluster assembly transcription factor